jgi:hypothetical protein
MLRHATSKYDGRRIYTADSRRPERARLTSWLLLLFG